LDTVLALSPTVSTLPVGEGLTIFDSATSTAISLNPTAADIAALADGTASVDDVVRILSETYRVDREAVRPHIVDACNHLVELNVLRAV
jgi:hypothetical protein